MNGSTMNDLVIIDLSRNIKFLVTEIKHKDKHLLMDNAKIYHTKKLKEYIKKKNMKVLYNIPYCPKFNPIENVNSMIRNSVKYNKK